MEFPAYLMNTLVCVWLLYWCTRNSARKPGTPVTGLFAYTEANPPEADPKARTGEPSGQWRGSR